MFVSWFSSVTITTQQKIDGIEAGRYACREDIDYLGTRFGDGNYFNFKLRNNVTTCRTPTKIAEG